MGEHLTESHHGSVVDDPIVIVGAACRLPGEATSLQALWDMMKSSRTGHGPVPSQRWNADAWYHPDPDRKGAITSKAGFILKEDIASFDAPFFSITTKEAAGMDPAKRLLLEVSYEAFENAGMPMGQLAGSRTGVYVGCMTSDYEDISTHNMYDLAHNAAAGVSEAMTANRVSWFFDLRGPSLTIDTACSSSLYALHLACQSLHLGETDMALVSGVNLILYPNFMAQLTAMHMLSPDGTSHSFDSRANGYGRGEGIGAIVIKRLSDALRAGDVVRAVIRSSAVNVDGKTPSITMPSSEAQADLIKTAYKRAGLPLTETRYVEMHGTGTPVGDPIELSAIASTFGASAAPENPVYVGSIKPNVGHTEGCAGLAGVLRAIVSLEKGIILPTANVERLNPKLKFKDWHLALPTGSIPWPSQGIRRISVNSFGFGGANAHVVLDDAYHYMKDRSVEGAHATDIIPEAHQSPEQHRESQVNSSMKPLDQVESRLMTGGTRTRSRTKSTCSIPKVFVFSSRDQPGLQRTAKSLGAYFASAREKTTGKQTTPTYLADVAYTLATRRSLFDYRSFVVSDSLEDLPLQFEKSLPSFRRPTKMHGIVFVFTGQGAQWAGMGKELLTYRVFADSIARSAACLSSLGCCFDLLAELQRTHGSSIDSPDYSQPICTAVQVAIVQLLSYWSITPKAVIGHSSGEIAAAFATGIITHEDAIKVAYFRGIYSLRVAQGLRRGAMLAAGISADEARQFIGSLPENSIAVAACINSPKSVTISGDVDAVSLLEERITSERKFARKLRVSTAYHSPHMLDVAEECLAAMNASGFSPPQRTGVLMFSSVTGDLVDHWEVDTSYWIRNMCQPVLFSDAMQNLLTHSNSPNRRGSRRVPYKWNSIVEVGPHSALKAPIVQTMEGVDKTLPTELTYLSVLVRNEDAVATALRAAGTFWALGNPVSLERVNSQVEGDYKPQVLIDIPPYPWNHDKQYWHETSGTKSERLKKQPRTDLLGVPVEDQIQFAPQWKNYLCISENPWIEDHSITGTILYPGAGMLIMVLEAAKQIATKGAAVRGFEFRDVHFDRGLVVPGEGAIETRLSVRLPEEQDERLYGFAVFSNTGNSTWVKHCFGRFLIQYDLDPDDLGQLGWARCKEELDQLKKLSSQVIDVENLYQGLHDIGMEYGNTFQNVTALTATDDGTGCYGTVKIPDTKSVMPFEFEYPHLIHPATLDAIFHLIVVAVSDRGSWKEAAVPYRLDRMFIANDLPKGSGTLFSGYSRRRRQTSSHGLLCADLVVSDETWKHPKIIVEGLNMRQVSGTVSSSQTTEGTSSGVTRRCTLLRWKLDPVAFIEASSTVANSLASLKTVASLKDWVDVECHRTPDLRLIIDGDTLDPAVVEHLRPYISGVTEYRGLSKLTVIGATQGVLDSWRHVIETCRTTADVEYQVIHEKADDNQKPLVIAKFDLVLTAPLGNNELLESAVSKWTSLLQPRGRVLMFANSDASPSAGAQRNGLTNTSFAARTITLDEGYLTVAAPLREATPTQQPVCLLVPEAYTSAQAEALAQEVERQLLAQHRSVRKSFITNVLDDFHGEYIISLLDLGSRGGFVTNWTPFKFDIFRQLIGSARHILWLTRGAQMLVPEASGLENAATTGILRVIRNEFPQVTLTHLDLSPAVDPSNADAVLRLWAFSVEEDGDGKDLEFAELEGELYIPRAVQEASFDEEIALATGTAPPVTAALSSAGPLQLDMDRLMWHSVGDNESRPEIQPDYVEVRVTSISATTGNPPSANPLRAFWSQTTGIITACGSDVETLSEDDHVVILGNTSRRTHLRLHQSDVKKVPSTITSQGAATIIWLHLIASYILERVASLQCDDTVLICDCLAPLSQALISLARNKGSRILATATNGKEKEEALKRLGLSDKSVLDSQSASIGSFIRDTTNNDGVDVVIAPSLHQDVFRDVPTFIRDFGRITVIVDGDAQDHAPPRKLGNRNLIYATVNPGEILASRPDIVRGLLKQIPVLFAPGSQVAVPSLSKLSVSQLNEAVKLSRTLDEKLVATVEFYGNALVPLVPRSQLIVQLPADGTYILAGGLGSLGLRIARLLVEHGAKHVVLLSRSGNTHKWVNAIDEIRSLKASVDVLKCDVTRKEDVDEAICSLTKQGRKIRGVVQCAMVLQDSVFSNMTHTQWQAAFAPKVAGTWHLHNSVPASEVDFFILLSSVVSVIGNVSQANYAAANSFMDAFAHYRRTGLGLPAVSLNVGLVRDSDHEIDGTGMEHYLERFGHMASVSTTLDELDIGLLACIGRGDKVPPQVVFGMSDRLRMEDQWAHDKKFAHRLERALTGEGEADSLEKDVELRALAGAGSVPEAATVVAEVLKRLIAPGLGVQTGDIADDKPLFEVGVDSFKAVEIRNQVFRELRSDISVFEILSSMPLGELSGLIATRSQLLSAEAKASIG